MYKKIYIILLILVTGIIVSCNKTENQEITNAKDEAITNLSDKNWKKVMDKKHFWSIIEKAKNTDSEIMYLNLINEISKLSEDEVIVFNAYIGSYTEITNDTIWVDMACKVINGYVSDDTGLYFSLWLIAQGEATLLNALKDPDSLSELPKIPFGNAEFEMLMSIGMNENTDYEKIISISEKIVEEINPGIIIKNGKKYGDYKSFEDAMKDIPNILPKLIKRAERNGFDWKNYI
ncbi:MAG: DUF4240 domain-containing protein [Fusobacteriaceae bacterium]|jgi:hypothetical protein|nr:DUF4240 domain-containing protein [Fusobacteriaceae bacterium]